MYGILPCDASDRLIGKIQSGGGPHVVAGNGAPPRTKFFLGSPGDDELDVLSHGVAKSLFFFSAIRRAMSSLPARPLALPSSQIRRNATKSRAVSLSMAFGDRFFAAMKE
jgi:hypothetical protein